MGVMDKSFKIIKITIIFISLWFLFSFLTLQVLDT